MSRLSIGRLIVTALGGIIGALTFVGFPALAGNPVLAAGMQGVGNVIIPLQTPTPTPTPTPGTPFLTTDLFIPFLFIVLPFGLLLIAGLLFYIYRIQLKYYAATQRLSQMGVGVKAVPTSAYQFNAALAPTVTLTIDGPGFVAIGASADFTVKKNPANAAGDVNWLPDPVDAASVSPKTGEKVTVVPLKKGAFVLTASIGTPPTAQSSVSVAAVDPPTSEELPFIGQGYGSLVIAVLVVVAVIVLALTGVLAGEAVATLLGGLLGYIFGVTTAGGGTSAKKTTGQTPSTSG